MLLHVIPSAVSYCEVCDGDARVIVMFALRKLIPSLAPNYYQSRDLRAIFLDKVLCHLPIPPLLKDQSPVPQYMIRLLSEIASASPDCCQDLISCCFLHKPLQQGQGQGQQIQRQGKKSEEENVIQLLFHFLLQEPMTPPLTTAAGAGESAPPRHELISSDPQVLILLRQLLSSVPSSPSPSPSSPSSVSPSEELYLLLMRQGLCSVLNRSLLSSIQSMNSDLLLVTLELLLTLLATSRSQLHRLSHQQQQLRRHNNDGNHDNSTSRASASASAILTSLETHFQPLLLPLLTVLLWKPTPPSLATAAVTGTATAASQSGEQGDPLLLLSSSSSVIFLLHDCILKTILLLIDLIPDLVVESLLQDKPSSASRFSRIFRNDQVSLLSLSLTLSDFSLCISLSLSQWDLRLLSKFLNVLLKLLKVHHHLSLSLPPPASLSLSPHPRSLHRT
jgi:hypothetical protein